MGREQPKEKRTGGDFAAATRRSGASAALGHMVEHRLPTTGLPPAAGPRRHSRRPRRRCRLLLPPTFALALLSLAYLSFSSHASLPFHPIHQGPMNRENVGKGMDKRDKRNTTVKENISMTIDKSEPFIKGRKKKSYGPCEIEFLPSVDNLVEPADYNNFTQFLLKYILTEGHLIGNGIFEPLFAGHQSLQEREETYYAKNQSLHCGFVEGPEGYPSSGFDLDEHDRAYMATCRVVVSSCIFGGSDYLRRPTKSRIGSYSKKNVCFIMFLDELTLTTLSSEGHIPDENGSIGLWRIVVVKNLPYKDMRRAGKVPKLLAHRLFPSALYSIWLDSKLRLHADPMLIIEYFLWRKKAEYAISVHYDRTCVWEEVLQNKRLNKYNHTAIDEQFYFYQSDGLVKFNASGHDPVLPSYVPEGSFIVRAHTPMSNLFSCLWFNEVNRFTSRDQLSFAYTYLKLRRMNAGRNFQLNMFKDCERRAVAKLFHHRANGTTDPPPKNLRTDKNHSSMPS
ncbi:probable hexosyltransferase MUCI70 [Aegilops tauschii subsp. strangulata]|nr:probable hexosyltransferase MUCI70 [Aegilops tauschii subsp. strangulata]